MKVVSPSFVRKVHPWRGALLLAWPEEGWGRGALVQKHVCVRLYCVLAIGIYTFSAHKYIIKNLCKRRAGIERPTTRMRWKEGNENGWSDGFNLISNQHWDRLMCLLLLLLLASQDNLSCSHEWGFVRMESPKATENTLIETWLEIFRNINGWR